MLNTSGLPSRMARLGVSLSMAGALTLGLGFGNAWADQGMVTDLYRYYPQKTLVFLEWAPEQPMVERFLRYMGRVAAKESGESQAQWQQDTQAMMATYNTYMEKPFATGLWMVPAKPQPTPSAVKQQNPPKPATAKGKAEPAKAAQTTASKPTQPKWDVKPVTVFTLKPNANTEALLQEVLTHLGDGKPYKQTDYQGTALWVSESPKNPVVTIHEGHLVLTDTRETMTEVLDQARQPETSIVQTPLVQTYISQLPETRQGTVIYTTQTLAGIPTLQAAGLRMLKDTEAVKGQSDKLQAFMQQTMQAFPGMVASIETQPGTDTLLTFNGLGPVHWDAFEDAALRDSMRKLIQQGTSVPMAASVMPDTTVMTAVMAGLGGYYDLFTQHLATPQTLEALNKMQPLMAMMGLDFRKNIIALFDRHVVFGLNNTHPKDFWVFLNQTEDTAQTLNRLKALVSLDKKIQLEERPLSNQQTLTTIAISPGELPIQPAVTQLPPDYLAVGNVSALEQLADVNSSKRQALTRNPLYNSLTAGMPESSLSFFYMDAARLAPMLEKVMPMTKATKPDGKTESQPKATAKQSSAPDWQTLLYGLEGFSFHSYYDEARQQVRGAMWVKLAPAQTATGP